MVYLLCFDKKLKHAKHYIGFAESNESFEKRLKHHRSGNGSKLMAAVAKAQIEFQVSRTWPTGDRTFERKLKNQKNAALLCPHCKLTATQSRLAKRLEGRSNERLQGLAAKAHEPAQLAKDLAHLDHGDTPTFIAPAVEIPQGNEVTHAELPNLLLACPVVESFKIRHDKQYPIEVAETLVQAFDKGEIYAQPKSPAHLSRWQRIRFYMASFLRLREIYRLFKR